eukprot:2000827-Alexandrium_andersonii.AAC.1
MDQASMEYYLQLSDTDLASELFEDEEKDILRAHRDRRDPHLVLSFEFSPQEELMLLQKLRELTATEAAELAEAFSTGGRRTHHS